MIRLKSLLNEASKNDVQVYHQSFSSAVQAARKYAENKGYTIDEDDWAREITFGRGRPKVGQTTRASIGLIKNGKPQRKALQIQVYGMPEQPGAMGGSYELNMYIN